MASTVRVVVTGDKQIDKALRRLDTKIQRKTVMAALRKSREKAYNDYISRVPVKSGAMRDATLKRAAKGKKKRGVIGVSLVIDRKKLFAKYEAHYGRLPGKRTKDSEPFFYPTVVEFGDKDTPAEKPLREAVYGNEEAIKRIFLNELRLALNVI